MKLSLDCRYFIGEKPCKYNRLCDGCPHYDSFGTKILIIKLGAMGDVVRTTPIIPIIAEKYKKYHLTWLVDGKSRLFIDGNPDVHRVINYNTESVLRLMIEKFDVVYSLDKEVRATSIATLVKAKKKFGFGFHPKGNIYPLTPEAEESFALGMSDEIKFSKNQKTYQRDILDAIKFNDISYGNYQIPLENFDLDYGTEMLRRRDIQPKRIVIGLNTGAGDIFKTKCYLADSFITLIEKISSELDATILILGGTSETDRNKYISDQFTDNSSVIHTGCDNPIENFIGIINCCDILVTGDTLALHLGLALKKRVVGLFGSTCAQEIDMYGLGEKLVSLPDCAPCYKKDCPNDGENYMKCMKQLTPQQVFDSIKQQIGAVEK